MANDIKVLTYKGHPLMRKDNLIYYGSMADSHIVMLQILETKKVRLISFKKNSLFAPLLQKSWQSLKLLAQPIIF